MSTDAKDLHGVFHRLGAPAEVAEAAATEYRRKRFSGRHPVLMFVVLPVVALPLCWAASIFALVMLVKAFGLETGKVVTSGAVYQWAAAVGPYVMVALMTLPVSLAAALFCRIASNAGVSWKWMLTACVLLAVIGGAAMAQFALPTELTQGQFSFGFGFSLHPSASQVLQFLLPLSIGGWAVWRQISRSQSSLAA